MPQSLLLLLATAQLIICACNVQITPLGEMAPEVKANPIGAQISAPIEVTLSAFPANAIIYYTTDGTQPTRSSVLYKNEKLQIDKSTDLRFFAEIGEQSSPIYIERYVLVKTASEPSIPDPTTTDPAPTDPAPTDPSTTDPSTTDPAPTDPSTTDPSTTDPATPDPSTTDPSTTDPSTTDPSTTDPSTTDPSTPDPDSTQKDLFPGFASITLRDSNDAISTMDKHIKGDYLFLVFAGGTGDAYSVQLASEINSNSSLNSATAVGKCTIITVLNVSGSYGTYSQWMNKYKGTPTGDHSYSVSSFNTVAEVFGKTVNGYPTVYVIDTATGKAVSSSRDTNNFVNNYCNQ